MTEEKENIIKEVCKELNITQTELGRQLDVSASLFLFFFLKATSQHFIL